MNDVPVRLGDFQLNRLKAAVRAVHGLVCHYCNEHGDTVDHVAARSSGGADAAENMVVACKSCNSSKGRWPLDDECLCVALDKAARLAPEVERLLSDPAFIGVEQKGHRLALMLTDAELEQLDDWRFKNRCPSRAEAVRAIIRLGYQELSTRAHVAARTPAPGRAPA